MAMASGKKPRECLSFIVYRYCKSNENEFIRLDKDMTERHGNGTGK